jgi:hypothetical protein
MVYQFPRLDLTPPAAEGEGGNATEPDPKKDILYQMQLLFAKMQFLDVSSVSTSGLTTSFGWDK